MVFNRDMIYLSETYNIKLSENVLVKLEDAVRCKKDLLITIDASHYAFRNGNWTVYRHDTVRNDIPTFVAPSPKPIIEKHSLKDSKKFGAVIAADYKYTSFYDKLIGNLDIESYSSEEYIQFMKDEVLPVQFSDHTYNGLAYVELVGKINHQDGIKKVLNKEFLTVSIGAIPRRLICSECLQDQTQGICDHYGTRSNRVFMLAESLEYEELSFVRKPADRFGKITRIHDGKMDEVRFETDGIPIEASVDVIKLQDFFQETEGKTIVCMNNICAVINNKEEDGMARKSDGTKVSMSLTTEFDSAKVTAIVDSLQGVNGSLELAEDLTDRQFGIVQKTDEGLKRRFPLCDELNVSVGLKLVDEATDLTDVERDKVKAALNKAAKKLGIELKDETQKGTTEEDTNETQNAVDELSDQQEDNTDTSTEDAPVKKTVEELVDELNEALKGCTFPEPEDSVDVLQDDADGVENPVTRIFNVLKNLATDFKYAGAVLEGNINSYLLDAGRKAVEAGHYDSLEVETTNLKDQVKELEDEITLLDEQNRELNYQIRGILVDEIVSAREVLGLLEDGLEEEKTKLGKLNYDALVVMVNDCRKLKTKLNDSTVNNNIDIKTVQDPTLTDSEQGEVDTLQDSIQEEETELTFDQKVKLMKNLYRQIRRH